jgi:hypothetical protein
MLNNLINECERCALNILEKGLGGVGNMLIRCLQLMTMASLKLNNAEDHCANAAQQKISGLV